MRKRLKLILAFLLLGTSLNLHKIPVNAKKNDLDPTFTDISGCIFDGIVVTLESRWINTTEYNRIYSFVEIEVDRYLKHSVKKTKTISMVVPSGKVGDVVRRFFSDPGGELVCFQGQKIRVYGIPSDEFEGYIHPLKIEHKTEPMQILESGPTTWIYEEQKCFFEYIEGNG